MLHDDFHEHHRYCFSTFSVFRATYEPISLCSILVEYQSDDTPSLEIDQAAIFY